ncbi:hypothetical protein JYT96_00980 [Gammaproteobacteria bacterium AH-315-C21]|nr:hypothetical protein [Gammaproteobacteria bacterium AH-315-C21]
MSRLIRILTTVLILLFISACSDGNGTSTAPATADAGIPGNLIDTDPADNTVIESAAIGAGTGFTALLDGITAPTTVTYSLTDNAGGAFTIDPSSGVVTVAGLLDFETASSLILAILATPSEGDPVEESFTFTISDNFSPTVVINFPSDNSVIVGDSTTVSGTATDPEGDAIDSIIVSSGGNDITATVDADGNWSAQNLPLGRGNNEITVTTTDANGEVSVTTINVTAQATVISAPGSAIADGDRNRILVIDAGTGGINIVDENTGDITPFPVDFIGGTLPGSANADEFNALSGAGELDAANDRLFVVENTLAGDNLLQIDLTDDSVTRLPVRVETGIDQFAVDSANNQLLAIDPTAPAIIAVDLDNNSTTVVSNNTGIGAGPDLVTPTRIAIDNTNNQAVVYDEGIPGFLTVDPDTGDRALLSGLPAGITDPTLVRSIDVDETNNRLLVVTPTSVFTVDLDNGALAVLSGTDVVTPSDELFGNGPLLVDASAITVDGTRALVSDNNGAIIAIDLATGDRTIIGSNTPALLAAERYTNVIVDDATGNVFLYSLIPDSNNLIINDTANGSTSTVVINQSTIEIDTTQFIVDFSNNIAYFFTAYGDGIAALNLASGLLTIVSDNTNVGSGIEFQFPTALALDAANNRILYTDAYNYNPGVRAIDLSNGDRSIFFADGLPWPTAIIVDAAQGRALVADDGKQTLVVIDLDSAEGTVFNALPNDYLNVNFAVIAVDSNSDLAYLLSPITRVLSSVNLITGEALVVSAIDDNGAESAGGNQIGNGLGFIIPIAIAWDEVGQRLFVADPAVNGIVTVEPNSGDRAINVN